MCFAVYSSTNIAVNSINYICHVESSRNVMAHGDAWEGKWRGNWQMEWVASTLHTTSEHGVSSITTADAHTLDASSQLNRRPADLNGLVHFTKRRNLVSARVPSHFNWPLQLLVLLLNSHLLCPESSLFPQYHTFILYSKILNFVHRDKCDICGHIAND